MTGDRTLLIGTAGWSVPRDAFPAGGSHLERYASMMAAVEINSSFRRLHRRQTYERWAASTPTGFRFSVKIPKEISHVRKLVDTSEPLETFIEQVGGLGTKLGVILLQLPPSFAFDCETAIAFFSLLRGRIGPEIAIACEPRHPTWFGTDAETCLIEYRVARVAADPVLAAGGKRAGGWSGLRYHRLHGSPRIYYSSYDIPALEVLAASLVSGAVAEGATWCIFDNTASGAAFGDALKLRSLIASAS